jgi:hypothetical protein
VICEGFKLTVDREEMEVHLRNRSAYHSQRAEQKSAELPVLKQSLETIKGAAASGMMPTKSNYCLNTDDPIEKLEYDIESHKAKAHYFRFAADHLGHSLEFVLNDAELARLEFVKVK